MADEERDFHFDRAFWRALCTITPLMLPRVEWAGLLLLATLALVVGQEFVNYYSGMIVGKFYEQLLNRDEAGFWRVFWTASGLYTGQCLVLGTISLSTGGLYLALRRNFTYALHSVYFSRKGVGPSPCYTLNTKAGELDNPDQRISQDVERACNLLANKIAPAVLIAPCVIGYYTWKTWSTAGGLGVAIIYGYFVVGSIVNRLLMSPITRWVARVEKAEGDFRFKHMSVRRCAEESAFCRAEEFEQQHANEAFSHLLYRQLILILWRYPSQFLQNFFDYYGGVLSYALQVFPIFVLHSYDGLSAAELGMKISNNAFVYIYLVNSFTRLTDLAMSAAEVAGYLQRISELVDFCRKDHENNSITSYVDEKGDDDEKSLIRFERVSYALPDSGTELMTDLSLSLSSSPLLVTGESGAGKSSLFRVLAGLWTVQQGSIHSSLPPSRVMFLPQRPYLPTGRLSLRQQVMFPLPLCTLSSDKDRGAMESILCDVGLAHLIATCGGIDERVHFEWCTQLSPGEQQRLSIARLLFHAPTLAVLDEATSSLPEATEAHMYGLIEKWKIAYVSAGHRRTLRKWHARELRLTGESSYEIRPIHTEHTLDSD